MKLTKMIAGVVFCAAFAGVAFAQQTVKSQKSAGTESTVEKEYLSNVEDVIITELATSPEYDNKLVALQYLEEAVNEGRTSPDIVAALQGLAGEGVTKQERTGRRVMNNFPDIRAKACDLLGEVPSEEAKSTLMVIAQDDKEPMVVSAAVRSLGNIGLNNGNEVVNMIAFIQKKYAALNPTSSLALEILVAYEKLAATVTEPADRSTMIESVTEIASNYHFVTPVRTKALQLLKALQGKSTGKKSK